MGLDGGCDVGEKHKERLSIVIVVVMVLFATAVYPIFARG